ncbi:MAG TPA: 3-deoxy-D-manno-octulosonic acid transferase [Candidatus Sulfotelmatobacter sp.]
MALSLPYWLVQMLRHGKYRRGLAERLGRVPLRIEMSAKEVESGSFSPARVIWVHAVSVGEIIAVGGLIASLRARFPRHKVYISTTTDTGQAMAQKRFGRENVFYFPLDFAFAIRPYLRMLRPELVVIAETEFWPNFLRLANANGARIAIVNARISDRSWPNYRRFRWLLRRVLSDVTLFLAQTDEDAARLRAIGAAENRIKVTGNLKFDAAIPDSLPIVEDLRRSFAETSAGPVLVCGSTAEGEEPQLLKAFESLLPSHPRAVMILAPRHPERFAPVEALLQKTNVRFCRRSLWKGEALTGSVMLVDAMGELAALYRLADVAFVGGSLVPHGGHNIIEPAQYGAAIVVGNYTENFRDIVSLFQSRDAVRIAASAELPWVFTDLFDHPEERIALGRRAAETLRLQTGATERTLEAVANLLTSFAMPRPPEAVEPATPLK